MTDAEMDELLDVPFTFSLHCRSGLLARCECRRCRTERGEPVTDETNVLAESQAKEADRAFHESTMRILDLTPEDLAR